MKPFRGTLVLLILVLLLGGYVYFIEIQGVKKQEEIKEKDKKVLLFEKKNIYLN